MASVAIVAATSMALIGCGGSLGEDQAREQATGYLADVLNGDYDAACARMSEAGAEALVNQVPIEQLELGVGCQGMQAKLAGPRKDTGAQYTASQQVADVDVQGDTATVRTGAGDVGLEEVNGQWKIAKPPMLR